jgi:hypothetical protein
MNSTVQSAIAEGIAALTETRRFPEDPYGYGSDVWCESDLHPRMIEVLDDNALVLAQHCVRRLDTPGGLPDEDEWGISISDYCNRPTTRAELYALEGLIVTELLGDDRIDEVKASVVASTDFSTLTISIRIKPLDPQLNDFMLILSASDAGLLIEEMTS